MLKAPDFNLANRIRGTLRIRGTTVLHCLTTKSTVKPLTSLEFSRPQAGLVLYYPAHPGNAQFYAWPIDWGIKDILRENGFDMR